MQVTTLPLASYHATHACGTAYIHDKLAVWHRLAGSFEVLDVPECGVEGYVGMTEDVLPTYVKNMKRKWWAQGSVHRNAPSGAQV